MSAIQFYLNCKYISPFSSTQCFTLLLSYSFLANVCLFRPNGHKLTVPWHNVHMSSVVEGDVVTFSYELQSRRELPLNPIVHRKRLDLEWDDVVDNHNKDQRFLNGMKSCSASDGSNGNEIGN